MEEPTTDVELTQTELWAVSRSISGYIAHIVQQTVVSREEKAIVNYLHGMAPKINAAYQRLVEKGRA